MKVAIKTKEIVIFALLLVFIILVLSASNFSNNSDKIELNTKSLELTTKVSINETLENISKTSKVFLLNFAIDELKEKIKIDMESHFLKAIVINDLFLGQNILVAYKDQNNTLIFHEELPKSYTKYKSLSKKIIDKKKYTQTTLGEITLYYNTNDNGLNLNSKQKEYLENKKMLKICVDPNWIPIESLENGKVVGISASYIKKFETLLNVPIKVVPTKTWSESLENIQNKKCDFLPLVSKTPLREKYLNFTTPYINTFIVIATKVGIPFIDDISTIEDKKFGIVKGYSIFAILKKRYPNIQLVEVDSAIDGLNKVEKNKIFGYIDNTIVMNYLIQNQFVGSLTVSGKLKTDIDLCVGVQKDQQILFEIFQQIIQTLDARTKQNILNQWVNTNYNLQTDYTILWQFLFIAFIIILGTIYWNRKLHHINKELEIQIDKAHQATQAKADFLANMSHEIRTPLNGIIGMSQLASKCHLDDNAKNYIAKIDYSGKILLAIINDILDFSKIESGKFQIQNGEFNLDELLKSIISSIEIKAVEKGLNLILNSKISSQNSYYGDSLRLSQILLNLLSNGIKFTNKGDITLEVIQLTTTKVQFTVIDTGIGIDKTNIDKLFSPFSQADSGITKKYGGTGLGLSISKQLVELMDGKIWLESEKGKGSKFIFEIKLPKLENSVQKKIKKQNSHLEQSSKNIYLNNNILLVEDNKVNQEIVVGLLEDTGINIDIANNGEEAISYYNEHPNKYQLIFMDIQMPILDGMEATKQIRKTNKHIPIVILTANIMAEGKEKLEKLGVDGYLIKPIDIEKLFAVIAQFIPHIVEEDKRASGIDYTTLPNLKHINTKLGLEQLFNNTTLYKKVLKNFYEQYKDLDITLIKEKDNFKRTIHTLKGLSGNIGASTLHSLILQTEQNDTQNNITLLSYELHSVIEEIGSINARLLGRKIEKIDKLKISKEKLEQLFHQLDDNIQTKRPNIYNKTIEEIEKFDLEKNDKKIFDEIQESLSKYNYQMAHKILFSYFKKD